MSVEGQLKSGFTCTSNTIWCVISGFEDLEGVGGLNSSPQNDFQSYYIYIVKIPKITTDYHSLKKHGFPTLPNKFFWKRMI